MNEARRKATVADSSEAAAAEQCLADLIEEITLRIERGEKFDTEEYQRRHPELATQILRLAPTLEVLDDLRTSGAVLRKGSDPAIPAPSGTAGGGAAGHLLGDYRIIREIGRGGMGVVYEAEQVSLGRRVALKVLPFAAVLDSKQVQRFKNEAYAAAQLHHSNIVPVYSVGCERGVHFYAMQYVEGHALDAVIDELRGLDAAVKAAGTAAGRNGDRSVSGAALRLASGPRADSSASSELPEGSPATGVEPPPRAEKAAEPDGRRSGGSATRPISSLTPASTRSASFFRSVADLGVQAAEALQHAHDLGVVHRDIKPANLILDWSGHLWVTDFGLAQYHHGASLTMSGDILGTLRYMSPEQALAKRVNVDHRTDVYSLGATLYELLTQEPAFGGKDREELIRQIVFEEPLRPRRRNRSIPLDLETIVLKAVEKDPSGRYASARDLAEDLRRFLDDRPIRARRPGPFKRALKWVRRHKVLSGAAGAILVVLLVSGAVVERARRTARILEAATFGQTGFPQAEERWLERVTDSLFRARSRAFSLYFKGRLDEALAVARVSLTARPDDLQLHARMVDALAELGLHDEALAHVEAMRKIDSENIHSLNALAYAAYFRGHLDEAERACRKVVAKGTDLWRGPMMLAGILWEKGDVDHAESLFAEILRRLPRQWMCLTNWARYLRGDGRLDEAMEKLERALKSHPRDADVLYSLARTLDQNGRGQEARAALEKCLELQADPRAAHVALARLDEKDGRINLAIAHCVEAIAAGVVNSEPYERLVSFFRRARSEDIDGPLSDALDRLWELGGAGRERDWRLLAALAVGHSRVRPREDLAKALDLARHAVGFAKKEDLPECLEVLAEVELLAGRDVEAVETLEQALRHPDARRQTKAQLDAVREKIAPVLPTYGSIDAALEAREQEVLVGEGATWRYFRGREEPPEGWRDPGFDDSSWESGPSGFGYGDEDDATIIDDMRGAYSSLYIRRAFEVPDPSRYEGFELTVRVDDGLVAWLNGEEIGRFRAGTAETPVAHDAVADTGGEPENIHFSLARTVVHKGTNVLSIHGLNRPIGGSDFSLLPTFKGILPEDPSKDAVLRERVRANENGSAHVSAYLEGRILEREGRHREAAEKFAQLVMDDSERDEPLLRLAGALRSAGDVEGAESRLREALPRRRILPGGLPDSARAGPLPRGVSLRRGLLGRTRGRPRGRGHRARGENRVRRA